MSIKSDFAELRRILDLRKVIEISIGKPIFKSQICCPFHSDKNPSFAIYRYNDYLKFKCYAASCGVGGDLFDFIKIYHDIPTTLGVIQWINEKRDDLQLIEQIEPEQILKKLDLAWEQRAFWSNLMRECKKFLLNPEGQKYRAWLTTRGVLDTAIQYLPIGFFSLELLEKAGISEKALKEHQVMIPRTFSESLAYFYFSTVSDLSRIKLRKINSGKKRDPHLFIGNELGVDIGFFGLNLFDGELLKEITLVEGETDVLVPQGISFIDFNRPTNFICRSGGAVVDEFALTTLQNAGVKKINIWPDNDDGGREIVQRISAQHTSLDLQLSVYWPKGYLEKEDPAEFIHRFSNLQTISPLLREGQYYVPSWLAEQAILEYKHKADPTDADERALKRNIISIGSNARLKGLDLDEYVKFVLNQYPHIREETLRSEILRTRKESAIQIIGEKAFLEKSDGYYIQKIEGKTGARTWVPITNFIIEYERIIQFLKGTSTDFDVPPAIEGWLICEGERIPILFEMDDFKRFENFMDTLRKVKPGGLTFDPNIFKSYFESILNSFNNTTNITKGFDILGLHKDKFIMPEWIVSDGKVEKNETYFVRTPDQFSRYYVTALVTDKNLLKETAEIIANKLLDCHGNPILPLVLTGFIAASPLVEMLDLYPGALYIEGEFDAGKSTICQLFMNLAANYPIHRGNVNIGSTPYYVENVFSRFSGLPVLWDDIKKDIVRGAVKTQFLRLLQNYHDRQGRGRLTRTIQTRPMSFIRGHLLMNGENLPTDEGSALSRVLTLRVRKHNFNHKKLGEMIAERHKFSALWPFYIAWLQKKSELILDEEFSQGENNKKTRIDYFINYVGTGLKLYLRFLHEEFGIDETLVQKYVDIYLVNSPKIRQRNKALQTNEEEAELFTRTLEELIISDRVSIGESNNYAPNVGFKEGDTVYIFPTIAIKEVEKYIDKSFSKSSLSELLKEKKYLNTRSASGLSRKSRGGKRQWTWPFKAKKLLTIKSMQDEFCELIESEIENE